MTRPSLEECMMDTAHIFARRSTCSRLSVGCIFSNEDMTAIDAIGYNGGAKGLANECESQEPGKCGHLHAEINASIKANYHVKNKKAFLTHSPCRICAKALINGGIVEVYYQEEYRDHSPMEMLREAGVKVVHMK